ncbi:ABC transporter, ATP-binding protein [Cutibacterium acnes HL005PA2]|uniref:ATP-binding cassette domain-containing protein n=1 Tax=Cutibacterium acnes TaxID=1747 RepID=UPI0001F0A202|nr:ABC transporter ATP-binding protein [Cutibacterium acnes]EFT30408.1 ABC transporter, ATP-binding protein [Cutibacterium acnes HL005PA2]
MRPSDDADRLPSPRGGPVLASTSKFEGPFSCHEPVIEIKDLDFYYSDKPVLNNVTLAITQGSCLALIGPNVSGKSTLCKILQGILAAPKTATTNVLGYPCGSRIACRAISYCADNDHLPQFLTGAEFISYTLSLRSPSVLGKPRLRGATADIFERLGMAGRHDDLMESYFHGMLKKTQIAAALLAHSPVIIIDESLNGIDIEAQMTIEDALFNHIRQGGTQIICSHDFAMLDRCATHVAMLDYGNMVEFSAVDQLRARHATIRDLIVGYMGLG